MDSTIVTSNLHAAALTFAPEWEEALRNNGFVVLNKKGEPETREATLTPVIFTQDQMDEVSREARILSSASAKMVAAARDHEEIRNMLLAPFSGDILQVAEANREGPPAAHNRTDIFGAHLAVEINAACPALSGYTDILANTFIEQVGKASGLSSEGIAKLQEENGSNSRALHDGLLAGYRAQKGDVPPREITILCRKKTTPLPELQYLVERFNEYGTPCRIVYPDQVETREGKLWLLGEKEPLDLVYRHMPTARLLELGPHLLAFFVSDPSTRGTVVLNNPAPHQESKVLHALLSMATRNAELADAAGLTENERGAIARIVPWTEILRGEAAMGPNGETIPNLRDWTAEHPEKLVIKGVVGDRGNKVFVGLEDEETRATKTQLAFGTAMDWPTLAHFDGEVAVVQALVEPIFGEVLLRTPEGEITTARVMKSGSFFDHGGIVGQVSPSYIGHRGEGGQFAPVLTWGVAQQLAEAWAKAHPDEPVVGPN